MGVIKNGSRGDSVKELQGKLGQLGFEVQADGIFGKGTEESVRKLQAAFGYDIDGMVGDGTKGLIDAQVGYGWNVSAPDATEKALRAQGKGKEADDLKAKRLGEKGAPAGGGKGVVSKGVKK